MLFTKVEGVKQYEEGILKDVAYDATNHYYPTIIVELDDEQVFGYQSKTDGTKKFFLVKVKHLEEGASFRVGGKTYQLENFLRFNL